LSTTGSIQSKKYAAIIFIVLFAFLGASPLYHSITYAQIKTPPTLYGRTFPPPIFYQLRNIPSYAITIPFNSLGKSPFEPAEVNIPVVMTVIWFNDDSGEHSVTTITNSSHLPPQIINSAAIPPNGGSFIHTFSKPGVYEYIDQFDPSMHGRIVVGTGIATTKNMNMLVGGLGDVPFNPSHAQRVVFSFVPKSISIPPTIAMSYQVTITNAIRPWLSFSHTYDTADGILDLELVPTHKPLSSSHVPSGFVTWGPDFRSQEAMRTTGTYHIEGPVLVDPSQYDIRVAIVAKDNQIFPKPIVSTFILLPKENVTSNTTTGTTPEFSQNVTKV
jgi:hypothetical protein